MPRRYNEAIYKDSVGALLEQRSPGNGGYHHRSRHKGGPPAKNYRLDNRANIKEIEAQNRQRRAEEAAPAAEPFKLRQFKNVKSRFASAAAAAAAAAPPPPPPPPPPPALQGPGAAAASAERTPPARDFLRKGAREKVAAELRHEAYRRRRRQDYEAVRNGNPTQAAAAGSRPSGSAGAAPARSRSPSSRTGSDDADGPGRRGPPSGSRGEEAGAHTADYRGERGVTPRKEAVPRAGDVAHLAPRSGRDFVAANRLQAAEMKARDVPDRDTTFTHDSYGRVPEYLVTRQEQWEREAERRKAEAPDPSCPPGMKLMPEEDRLRTLRQLQENEASCQSQLNKFPLVVQTPLLQRRVDDLNSKLKEIDEAKAIFSRTRVYIARDS
ncbi:unnamed protein product [Scytosiphon promiscuus]